MAVGKNIMLGRAEREYQVLWEIYTPPVSKVGVLAGVLVAGPRGLGGVRRHDAGSTSTGHLLFFFRKGGWQYVNPCSYMSNRILDLHGGKN